MENIENEVGQEWRGEERRKREMQRRDDGISAGLEREEGRESHKGGEREQK